MHYFGREVQNPYQVSASSHDRCILPSVITGTGESFALDNIAEARIAVRLGKHLRRWRGVLT